jgi:hypothetical protein
MKLSQHQSSEFTKLLYIGDSGTGKTGSLASLVGDGYQLKIIDLDDGLDILKAFVGREFPDKIDNVDFETLRDVFKPGKDLEGKDTLLVSPEAYVKTTKLLTQWTDGSKPSEFGPKGIVVIDSLTTLGRGAFEWARAANPTAKDPRQWYFAAQQTIENVIAMLTSAAFKSNVIVISHVNYKELEDGSTKGYASAVGSALGPILPRYFNTLVMATAMGTGKNVMRTVRTVPSPIVEGIKTPIPFLLDEAYPLSTGMAILFRALKSLEAPTENAPANKSAKIAL